MHYCYKTVETSYIITQSYIKIMYIILTTTHTTYIYDFQNPPSNAFRVSLVVKSLYAHAVNRHSIPVVGRRIEFVVS